MFVPGALAVGLVVVREDVESRTTNVYRGRVSVVDDCAPGAKDAAVRLRVGTDL